MLSMCIPILAEAKTELLDTFNAPKSTLQVSILGYAYIYAISHSFHPLTRVLFNVPSRYLFTNGLVDYI